MLCSCFLLLLVLVANRASCFRPASINHYQSRSSSPSIVYDETPRKPSRRRIRVKMASSEKDATSPLQRLSDMGLSLPPAPKPAANYIPCQKVGDVLYLSGHLPLQSDGTLFTGCMGDVSTFDKDLLDAITTDKDDLALTYGQKAARQVGLNLLASIQQAVGDLDQVEKVIKLFGVVQSTNDFHQQHLVLNGCSDLLVQVFGPDIGLHARSAIGTNALPLNIVVEIEAIVKVKDV